MNIIKKTSGVLLCGAITMSLFSFKNAEVNEASLKTANTVSCSSVELRSLAASPAIFTDIINLTERATGLNTNAITTRFVTITRVTSIIKKRSADFDLTAAKSKSLLSDL